MYTKTEAAFKILKDYGKPLHLKEIIRIALSNNMIETKGKTPASTLGADFHNENKRRVKRGESIRWCRLGEGMWGLVEWGLVPVEAKISKSKGKKKSKA